ncbi:hypothetical protein [Microcoleus sp. B3-A4]|uniref:hypothetical protein n=1 Tax=Microcoleus sp. B3-A4 TaxID=2818653 RepID=UPI002FD073E9
MPKFERKTIALRHLKFETNSSPHTKYKICQGHLGDNNTRARSVNGDRTLTF